MHALRRHKFLHHHVFGAPNQGRIDPASFSRILAEQQLLYRLDAPQEASLVSPADEFKFVTRTHFTNISYGLLQLRPKVDLSHGNLLMQSHVRASRCFSGLAVTDSAETKTAQELSQTSASSSSTIVAAIRHYGRCYFELSKARLSMLVMTTAGAGYVMGSGLAINYYGLSWTCLGTFCVAAAANTINQILEVDNDSQMKRTKGRPLPAGRISIEHAMAWATATSLGGVSMLASQANMVAAGLGAINLVLYTLIYTPLKQIHPANTWVGAVVGAVPPLLGWAAAVGEVSLGGWVLASALYFWQIPHFMAIAYLCRQDYAAGGFKMLSMEDETGRRTALVALRNCAYLVPLGFLAHRCGLTTEWFAVEAALLSVGMGSTAALFYHKPSNDRAKKLFRVSLLYLPLLLTAMLIHRRPNEHLLEKKSTSPLLETDCATDEADEETESSQRRRCRPPAAVFSVAPFPFLPVPDYYSSSQ